MAYLETPASKTLLRPFKIINLAKATFIKLENDCCTANKRII